MEIEYGWGTCHMDWGWSMLKITTDGSAHLDVSQVIGVEKPKQYFLTNEQLLEIYKIILANNFFKLISNHYDTNVIDGFCQTLKIMAEEKNIKFL